jgi:hypothetical protein
MCQFQSFSQIFLIIFFKKKLFLSSFFATHFEFIQQDSPITNVFFGIMKKKGIGPKTVGLLGQISACDS